MLVWSKLEAVPRSVILAARLNMTKHMWMSVGQLQMAARVLLMIMQVVQIVASLQGYDEACSRSASRATIQSWNGSYPHILQLRQQLNLNKASIGVLLSSCWGCGEFLKLVGLDAVVVCTATVVSTTSLTCPSLCCFRQVPLSRLKQITVLI